MGNRNIKRLVYIVSVLFGWGALISSFAYAGKGDFRQNPNSKRKPFTMEASKQTAPPASVGAVPPNSPPAPSGPPVHKGKGHSPHTGKK